jgi:hypothetical protein
MTRYNARESNYYSTGFGHGFINVTVWLADEGNAIFIFIFP